MKKCFTRGYEDSREKVRKSAIYCRSCFNCEYFYQAPGDKEEVCQNPSVLEYDMVYNNNNIFCSYWKPCETKNTMFKNTGRDRLK